MNICAIDIGKLNTAITIIKMHNGNARIISFDLYSIKCVNWKYLEKMLDQITIHVQSADAFIVEDQVQLSQGKSNYSILCNNVIQFAILGYLKGLKKHVVSCNPRTRYSFANSLCHDMTKPTKYTHAAVKQISIDLFKLHWRSKRLQFSVAIY